jgi:hypothetical protein
MMSTAEVLNAIQQVGNVFHVGNLVITVTVEEITVARAEHDLSRAAKNRTLAAAKWAEYGRDMTDGHFGLTGETIIYDWDDHLLDGRHRLTAVVTSGRSIFSVVVRGIDPREFYRIDSGKPRSMADVESIKNRTAPGVFAAALRLLSLYDGDGLGALKPPRATNDELEKIEAMYPDLEQSLSARTWPKRLIPPSVAVFFHFIFARVDSDAANTFMQKLGTGADLSEGNPVHTLRNRLLAEAQQEKRIPPVQLYAWIIKTWNAYAQGQALSRVSWASTERFPQVYQGDSLALPEVKTRKGREPR